jgi:hypothetical protein
MAADLQPIPESPPPPSELVSGWTFRVIPYGWLLGLYGNMTVKGRTASVNLPFDKLLKKTIGSGNTLLALMDYTQGAGLTRYAYKMLQVGPVVGIGFKF